MANIWTVVALLLCLCLAPAHATLVSSNRIKRFDQSHACVRLLTKDEVIGCGTSVPGYSGTLKYLPNDAKLQAFLTAAPAPPKSGSVGGGRWSLIVPVHLLTNTTLNKLTTMRIAGVFVIMPPNRGDYLNGARFPGLTTGWSPLAPSLRAMTGQSSGPAWNTHGHDLLMRKYPFGMVAIPSPRSSAHLFADPAQVSWTGQAASVFQEFSGISKKTRLNSQQLIDMAEKNTDADHQSYVARFRYGMYGSDNSHTCLRDRTCAPVGGFSVYSLFGSLNDTSREVVLLSTTIDTTGLFRGLSIGSHSRMAGLAVFLSVLYTLGDQEVLREALNNSSRTLVAAAFNGDAWDQQASRAFFSDIANFTCSRRLRPNGNVVAAQIAAQTMHDTHKNHGGLDDPGLLSSIDKLADMPFINDNAGMGNEFPAARPAPAPTHAAARDTTKGHGRRRTEHTSGSTSRSRRHRPSPEKHRGPLRRAGQLVWAVLSYLFRVFTNDFQATAPSDSSPHAHTLADAQDDDKPHSSKLTASSTLPGQDHFMWNVEYLHGSCYNPWRHSYRFQSLKPLSRVVRAIHIDRVAGGSKIYVRPVPSNHTSVVSAPSAQFANDLVSVVGARSKDPGGFRHTSVLKASAGPVPPTPLDALRRLDPPSHNPNRLNQSVHAAVVIGDYDTAYHGKFVGSMLDGPYNVPNFTGVHHSNASEYVGEVLSETATLTLRAVMVAMGVPPATFNNGSTDPLVAGTEVAKHIVQSLFECFTRHEWCTGQFSAWARTAQNQNWKDGVPSHYTSVYWKSIFRNIKGFPFAVYDQMQAHALSATRVIRNTTIPKEFHRAEPTLTEFHPGVDPGFGWDEGNARWSTSGGYNHSYFYPHATSEPQLFTESNWHRSVGVFLSRTQAPSIAEAMFAGGVAVMVLCFFFVFAMTRWLLPKKFKAL